MRENQIYRETLFFETFKKLWKDFPKKYQIKKDESPDFILSVNKTNIGFEITELTNEKNLSQDYPVKEKYSLEKKIVDRAKDLFHSYHQIPLHLSIHFSPKINCNTKRIESLSTEISNIVCSQIINFDLSISNEFEVNYPLPSELIQIHGFYLPEILDSVWYSLQGGFLPNINNQQLANLIHNKSKLIPKYKNKVDLVNLIVVEGIVPISWFDKFINWDSTIIQTEFNKVFLLRFLENKLYQIF